MWPLNKVRLLVVLGASILLAASAANAADTSRNTGGFSRGAQQQIDQPSTRGTKLPPLSAPQQSRPGGRQRVGVNRASTVPPAHQRPSNPARAHTR